MLPRMEYKTSGILFTLGKLCNVSISPVADLHVLGLAEQGALRIFLRSCLALDDSNL